MKITVDLKSEGSHCWEPETTYHVVQRYDFVDEDHSEWPYKWGPLSYPIMQRFILLVSRHQARRAVHPMLTFLKIDKIPTLMVSSTAAFWHIGLVYICAQCEQSWNKGHPKQPGLMMCLAAKTMHWGTQNIDRTASYILKVALPPSYQAAEV